MTQKIKSGNRPLQMLLVEDNPADVDLFLECLDEHHLDNLGNVHVVENGVDAISFLRKEGDYSDSPNIDLVFLDLNLPLKKGAEVLAEMKSDNKLRRTPVIVLTSSVAEEDILRTYDLNASAYLQKPRTLVGFESVTSAVVSFWLKLVQYPINVHEA